FEAVRGSLHRARAAFVRRAQERIEHGLLDAFELHLRTQIAAHFRDGERRSVGAARAFGDTVDKARDDHAVPLRECEGQSAFGRDSVIHTSFPQRLTALAESARPEAASQQGEGSEPESPAAPERLAAARLGIATAAAALLSSAYVDRSPAGRAG